MRHAMFASRITTWKIGDDAKLKKAKQNYM